MLDRNTPPPPCTTIVHTTKLPGPTFAQKCAATQMERRRRRQDLRAAQRNLEETKQQCIQELHRLKTILYQQRVIVQSLEMVDDDVDSTLYYYRRFTFDPPPTPTKLTVRPSTVFAGPLLVDQLQLVGHT